MGYGVLHFTSLEDDLPDPDPMGGMQRLWFTLQNGSGEAAGIMAV